MTDIVEQLRVGAVEAYALPIATVMDSAADEIERLRLTDAEREDIACAASRLDSDPNGPRDRQVAATLRGLLGRLGGER